MINKAKYSTQEYQMIAYRIHFLRDRITQLVSIAPQDWLVLPDSAKLSEPVSSLDDVMERVVLERAWEFGQGEEHDVCAQIRLHLDDSNIKLQVRTGLFENDLFSNCPSERQKLTEDLSRLAEGTSYVVVPQECDSNRICLTLNCPDHLLPLDLLAEVFAIVDQDIQNGIDRYCQQELGSKEHQVEQQKNLS
jgi:hypothetical protein